MTVNVNDTVERYTIAGVGPYPFTYRIFAETDLQVTALSTATPAVPTLLTYLTHYTVAGANASGGGSVTLTAGAATTYAGFTLDIRTNTVESQPTSIRNIGRFLPEIHEDAYDNLSRQIQDLNRRLLACVRFPDNTLNDGTMTPLSAWVSKYLTISSSGVLTPAALSSTAITAAIITSLMAGSPSEQAALAILLDNDLPLRADLADTTTAGKGNELISYRRTAAEIAASITPTNYFYPELNIKRYGPSTIDDGTGGTDAAPAFSAAARVATLRGGTIIVPKPAVQYVCLTPINFTNGDTVTPQPGYVVRGEASTYDTGRGHILIKHTGHAFDCAGTTGIRFYDLVIETDATTYPQTGFFLARNSIGNSQIYRFQNVTFIGKCSKSLYYNYGSEDDLIIGCTWFNHAADAGAKVFTWTANNILALSSTFITIATGNRSTLGHVVIGGEFFMDSTDTAADLIRLENASQTHFRDSWWDCRGRSFVFMDMTNGESNFCSFENIQGENSSPVPTYGFYLPDPGVSRSPTYLVVKDSYIPSATRAVYAGANVSPTACKFDGISEQASKGLEFVLRLQQSTVDRCSVLVIGESKQNLLIGDSSVWTITTRTNDYWFDTGATNKTWTPNTSALTITGALTVSNKKIGLSGNKMFFTVTLQAATSIVCANNTSLTGLPFAASAQSADVNVTNGTTGASIGNGYVFGTTIKLPAINVTTDAVVISGSSFVA